MANTEKVTLADARPIELQMLLTMVAGFIQRYDPERPKGHYCQLTFGEIDSERRVFMLYYEWVEPPKDDEEGEE